jgi:putative ABC transport system substrate-binding protein
LRVHVKELTGLAPDVVLAISPAVVAALQRETRTLPIVFVQVSDPVRLGFVASMANPGGNITGVSHFDFTIGGKWLEVLKEIAPHITRVAIIYSADNPSWRDYLRAIESIAASIKLETIPMGVRDAAEIDRAIADFALKPGGGLIVLPSPMAAKNRKEIVAASERYRLPAVYPLRYFVTSGGLISYGIDNIDVYRRAASYVDKILKGNKPGELAVEGPTKFEMVINLKTGIALGLSVPPTLLSLASEVIE